VLNLLEPKPTNYDIHFRIGSIPVRIHPLFWLIPLLLGIRPDVKPLHSFIWLAVVTVSILLHELGHALAIRFYGYRPWITLYGLGGLASYNPEEEFGYDPVLVLGEHLLRYRNTRRDVVIALAGPAAGFLFAGLIVGGIWLCGARIYFDWDLAGGRLVQWEIQGVANESLRQTFEYLLYINIFWGLVNLLPIFPLDGGQISRALLTARLGSQGLGTSFRLGMITGIGMVAIALLLWPKEQKLFGAIMFGILAFQNYQFLQGFQTYGGDILEGGGGGSRRRPAWDDDEDRGPRQPWETDDRDERW
jgi:stage IV sporulation protein FB